MNRLTRCRARLALLVACALSSVPATAAELFYLDHDAFDDRYVGPVGPLVLSGDIVPGDSLRLLRKILADPQRYLALNRLLIASTDGDPAEALKIVRLLTTLHSSVGVGPLVGKCAGACFYVFAAADERNTDGPALLGIVPVGVDPPPALREWAAATAMPEPLAAQLWRAREAPIYWLSEADERALGPRSNAFSRYLALRCGWSDVADALPAQWACRKRVTQDDARAALRRLAQ